MHARLGLVPQQAFLFSGTIASNLQYGKADASESDMWRALASPRQQDFVAQLPEGLDAPVRRAARTSRAGSGSGSPSRGRSSVDRRSTSSTTRSRHSTSPPMRRLRAALRAETRDATVLMVAHACQTVHRRRPDPRARARRNGWCRSPCRADAVLRDVSSRSSSRSCVWRTRHEHPVEDASPAGRLRRDMVRVRRWVRPCRRRSRTTSSLGAAAPWPAATGTRPLLLVVMLTVASVTLSVIGPRLLGHATNIIFSGSSGLSFRRG